MGNVSSFQRFSKSRNSAMSRAHGRKMNCSLSSNEMSKPAMPESVLLQQEFGRETLRPGEISMVQRVHSVGRRPQSRTHGQDAIGVLCTSSLQCTNQRGHYLFLLGHLDRRVAQLSGPAQQGATRPQRAGRAPHVWRGQTPRLYATCTLVTHMYATCTSCNETVGFSSSRAVRARVVRYARAGAG